MLPMRELQVANEIHQERLRQAEQFRLQLIAKAATKAKAKKVGNSRFFPALRTVTLINWRYIYQINQYKT